MSLLSLGRAEHLVGGVMSYECIGNGALPNTKNYLFRLSLTRDCNQGTSFDQNIDIGIYKQLNSNITFVKKINVPLTREHSVDTDKKSCAVLLYNVCVREAIYEFMVFDLPALSESYLITYQRCCRNMTISNILDPGRTGSTIMLELTTEGQKVCNQSALSDQLPPLVICVDQDLKLDLNSTDKEGDKIEYELCAPFIGGGPEGLGGSAGNPLGCNGIKPEPSACIPNLKEVSFVNTAFNALNPFPSSTPIQLINGILSARPNRLGQFVFGLCVKEYRNGVLLTLLRRDIQVNFAQCNPLLEASVQSNGRFGDTAVILHCNGDNPIKIINQSKDPQNIKTVYWEFKSPSNKIIIDSTFDFSKLFPDAGLYKGKLILNKGNECSDSAYLLVFSNKMVSGPINANYDSCNNAPVVFSLPGNSLLTTWDYGDSTSGVSLSHQYARPGKYIVKAITKTTVPMTILNFSSVCSDTSYYTINIFPAPSALSLTTKDSVFCYPRNLILSLNEVNDARYQYQWSLSNGRSFIGNMPSILLDKAETFKVSLKLTSPNGCMVQKNFTPTFITKEKPRAAFDVMNDKLNLRNPTIEITNRSLNAKTYLWDFGNQKSSTQINPMHTYDRIGSYKINLVAYHENGCTDSIARVITIGEITDFYMPNIFTPNGDGLNDELIPEGISSFASYEFSIYDRWGSLLFLSNDLLQGWDGKSTKSTRTPAADGVYIYQIQFTTEEGVKKIVKGSVTLVR